MTSSDLPLKARPHGEWNRGSEILAISLPQGLSVRNQLPGMITGLEPDGVHNVLVSIDAAGVTLLARVTIAAVSELQLRRGLQVWVLVKAVSLQGHGL